MLQRQVMLKEASERTKRAIRRDNLLIAVGWVVVVVLIVIRLGVLYEYGR